MLQLVKYKSRLKSFLSTAIEALCMLVGIGIVSLKITNFDSGFHLFGVFIVHFTSRLAVAIEVTDEFSRLIQIDSNDRVIASTPCMR